MRLADLLLRNELFQDNSKLRDPIEIVKFDVSASPVMDKATSSESIGNQMSETVVTSSDPIEIAAVTRSQFNILLRLMTEILVQSHCQMRRTECSER